MPGGGPSGGRRGGATGLWPMSMVSIRMSDTTKVESPVSLRMCVMNIESCTTFLALTAESFCSPQLTTT